MSHLKERAEKTCLNCQASLIGRYCHLCGQENLEPKETVWHLVQHFFNDITHFDGKFFSTVKYLLRRPGFLSAEYMVGRRASYLNPIRMYVFTSAIFFLILFTLKKPEDMVNMNDNSAKDSGKGLYELQKLDSTLEVKLARAKDADDRADLRDQIAKLNIEISEIKKEYGDTVQRKFTKADRTSLWEQALDDTLVSRNLRPAFRDSVKRVLQRHKENADQGFSMFGSSEGRYTSVEAYDSSESKLPDSLKDGWLQRAFVRKGVAANVEYHKDPKRYFEHFAENMLHSIPKILFVSLPFFALILNILYARRKKIYYYVSHGIFAIHLYCALFILIMAAILLYKLAAFLGWGWFRVIADIGIFAIVLYILIYLYKAMRGFYRQGRVKTFIKYLLLCFVAFIVNSVLLVIFLLLSLVSI